MFKHIFCSGNIFTTTNIVSSMDTNLIFVIHVSCYFYEIINVASKHFLIAYMYVVCRLKFMCIHDISQKFSSWENELVGSTMCKKFFWWILFGMAFRSNILIVYLNILMEMGMLQLTYSRYIISKDEILIDKYITIIRIRLKNNWHLH